MNIEEIKEKTGANEVLFAMTTGSTLYGVENPKDEDIVVVVDKKSKIARCSTSGKMFLFTTSMSIKGGYLKVRSLLGTNLVRT